MASYLSCFSFQLLNLISFSMCFINNLSRTHKIRKTFFNVLHNFVHLCLQLLFLYSLLLGSDLKVADRMPGTKAEEIFTNMSQKAVPSIMVGPQILYSLSIPLVECNCHLIIILGDISSGYRLRLFFLRVFKKAGIVE